MNATDRLQLALDADHRTHRDEQAIVRQLMFIFAAHSLIAVVAASALRTYPLLHPRYSGAMMAYSIITYLLAAVALLGYIVLAAGLWPRTPLRAKPLAEMLNPTTQPQDDDVLRDSLAALHASIADRRDASSRVRRRCLRLAYLALFHAAVLLVVQIALEKIIWSLA